MLETILTSLVAWSIFGGVYICIFAGMTDKSEIDKMSKSAELFHTFISGPIVWGLIILQKDDSPSN